jgi:hypothetical protein
VAYLFFFSPPPPKLHSWITLYYNKAGNCCCFATLHSLAQPIRMLSLLHTNIKIIKSFHFDSPRQIFLANLKRRKQNSRNFVLLAKKKFTHKYKWTHKVKLFFNNINVIKHAACVNTSSSMVNLEKITFHTVA